MVYFSFKNLLNYLLLDLYLEIFNYCKHLPTAVNINFRTHLFRIPEINLCNILLNVSPNKIDYTLKYHNIIQFTLGQPVNDSINFLDITISLETNGIVNNCYGTEAVWTISQLYAQCFFEIQNICHQHVLSTLQF